MKTKDVARTTSRLAIFTAIFLSLAVIAGMLPEQAESATVTLTTAENVTAKVTLNSPAAGKTVADFFVFGDNVKKSGGTSSFSDVTSNTGAAGMQTSNTAVPVAWTGGTPTASSAGSPDYDALGFGSSYSPRSTYAQFTVTMPTASGTLDFWMRPNGNTGTLSYKVTTGGVANTYTDSSGDNDLQHLAYSISAASVGEVITVMIDTVSGSNGWHNMGFVAAQLTVPAATVTFQAGSGGTISSGVTPQTVMQGGSCTAVTAAPNTGYQFVNWTGTGGFAGSANNSLTVSNVTADMTLTANFQLIPTKIIALSGDLSFGSVSVGATGQKNFTIQNTGNSVLTVSSISYPTGFTGNWSGGTIAAGGSQAVTVTFAPTAAQSYTGSVTVISDKTSGTETLAISGTGTAVPTKIIALSGDLSFGSVSVGATGQKSFTIQNTGNSALTVSSISYPTGFTGNWNSGTVAAGGSQAVTVTFAPTAAQSYTGSVTVSSDKTGGTNTLAVSGTGMVGATKIISLSGSLDFGTVCTGSKLRKSFTIQNTGNSPLNISSITYPSGFTGDWNSGTVAAGASQAVTIKFVPTAAQSYSGTLTVSSDKTDGTNTMLLSGTGTSSQMSIINVSGSLAFGDAFIGKTITRSINISNSGNKYLNISSLTFPVGFTCSTVSMGLSPGLSSSLSISFEPDAAQSYSGTLTINSDAGSGTNTIPVSGTGLEVSKIVGLSGSLAFGDVNISGVPKKLPFTISNTGESDLTVSSISFPAGFTGNWSSGTVPKGGSQSVTVTFGPTGVQAYSGTITVSSNKTDGENTIPVSGNGIQVPLSYTISGYVKDADNTGMGDVTLTFDNKGGSAVTDASGYYSKTFSAAWTGRVTPAKSGYGFSPVGRSYRDADSDQTDQNYTGGQNLSSFRIWIDKNGNGVYDAGEGVEGASVRVNNDTTDRGVTDSEGNIALQNVGIDDRIYAQKLFYSMNAPRADDKNFANTRSKNPYYAGTVNGKMYDFVMASDIMAADGSYNDFPGQGKNLATATKDAQGSILVRLVHPKIAWNLVVAFQEAQSAEFLDKIRTGFKSYADYMYNYTDGYSVVKNVVLVNGAYLNSKQWDFADVQILNEEWPSAIVFGIRDSGNISMGKVWAGRAPDQYNWYSALGHESGHYLFGFGDEYMNGNYTKVRDDSWTYRKTHDGGIREPNEFPKNYGLMDSNVDGTHELSDPTEYFPRTYSPSMNPDLVTNQFMENSGQSCWAFLKSYYQNDIKTQMAGQGFSDAFFNNLIVPPHTDGSYPGSDRTKRSEPAKMNHDTVTFIEWSPGSTRNTRDNENVSDADALVLDETGKPAVGAEVWLVSSDHRSFQGRANQNGIVQCGSLLIGKKLEAYLGGRKAEIVIDAKRERYVLTLPEKRMALRDDTSSGMVITAKPDSTNPKRLTITASGSLLSTAPSVTLSQTGGFSLSVPMTASGANQYSGTADCLYGSGNMQMSSGGSQAASQFKIFTTAFGPASGYYAPGNSLEMAYSPTSFTGTGPFVIMSSSMSVPPNNGLIQVGSVYGFGFSDAVTSVRNVIFNIKLPENGKGADLYLYGWNIATKTWVLIPGGERSLKYFSISIASLDYTAYSLFADPLPNDPTPPNPVTGFIASGSSGLWSVSLQWTTPIDTDVFAYDIRFNTVPVTEDNWDKCKSVGDIPKPAAPETIQSFTAEMPDPGVAYYFGIKAIDKADNVSVLAVSQPAKSQAKDTDGDGMPDAWEESNGLNPNVNDAQNDNDKDGLTNLEEYQNQTDPKHPDTDRDGFSDSDEVAQGTDPNNSKSHPISLSSSVPGDLDCDEEITLSDAITALRIVSGIDPPPVFCKNDVNGDGKIGLEEVIFILQKVAELR